ncbi:MAG: PHB depolymerase family esterase, partial [Verrucomicrobiota bacterium]
MTRFILIGAVLAAAWNCGAAAEAIELNRLIPEVEVHENAKPSPADELGIRPYLYHGEIGLSLPFRFYAPAAAESNKAPIPMIVWLHGAGSSGFDNHKNVCMELANRMILEEKTPCSLLFPQYRKEYNWWSYENDDGESKEGIAGSQTLDLIDEICEHVPTIDSRRIYLIGMSQGAFAIPSFLAAYPNRFAAAVMIAGGQRGFPEFWSKDEMIPVWVIYSEDDEIAMQGAEESV